MMKKHSFLRSSKLRLSHKENRLLILTLLNESLKHNGFEEITKLNFKKGEKLSL